MHQNRRKYFFVSILCIDSFYTQKSTTERYSSVVYSYIPQARSPFRLMKPASEHAHARLMARLS
jgi:hypothetical protein